MEVKDIFGIDGWKNHLEELSGKLNMPLLLMDKEGKVLLTCGDRNQLCSIIRENKDGLKFICSQTAGVMTSELKLTMNPVMDLCEAGLIRIAVPIIRDGEVIGQVAGCGLVTDIGEVEPFMISRQLDISEDKVTGLIRSVEKGDEKEIGEAADELFSRLNSS